MEFVLLGLSVAILLYIAGAIDSGVFLLLSQKGSLTRRFVPVPFWAMALAIISMMPMQLNVINAGVIFASAVTLAILTAYGSAALRVMKKER